MVAAEDGWRRNCDVGSFQELRTCLFSGAKGDFARLSFLCRIDELSFSLKVVLNWFCGTRAILATG